MVIFDVKVVFLGYLSNGWNMVYLVVLVGILIVGGLGFMSVIVKNMVFS